MAINFADNLAHLRSDSFRDAAGHGAAMQATTRDRNGIKCYFCGHVGHFKIKCSLRSSTSSRGMMDSSRSSVTDNKTTHADSTNDTVEAGEVRCGAQTSKQPPIATPSAPTGGANRLTATLSLMQPGLRG